MHGFEARALLQVTQSGPAIPHDAATLESSDQIVKIKENFYEMKIESVNVYTEEPNGNGAQSTGTVEYTDCISAKE